MAEAVEACVHCGFCLPTCPTYRTLGEEMDSPRGRIVLMKSMLEGELDLEQGLPFIDRCLGCVACVTACPSGVEYGELVSSFRAHCEEKRRRSLVDRALRAILLETLSRPRLLRLAARFAGLGRMVSPLLPSRLRAALELTPRRLEKAPRPLEASVETQQPAKGERARRVALLRGCAQDVLAPRITAAAEALLKRRGVDVVVPAKQGCCGALALHAGDEKRARRLGRKTLESFVGKAGDAADFDAVITTAAGCGSGLADYPLLFAGHDSHDAAQELASKSFDVTTFLASLKPVKSEPPRTKRPMVAVYQDACHLAHAQQERQAPRRLLEAIEGLELRSAEPWHQCCGSAGIYNLEQPEIARQLGREKAEAILGSGAELVISGNIGCMMQIEHHLRALGASLPVRHTVEVLDLAERGELGA